MKVAYLKIRSIFDFFLPGQTKICLDHWILLITVYSLDIYTGQKFSLYREIQISRFSRRTQSSLLWRAGQRELDHELAATGSTATCSVYSSNKVDKPVQTVLTAEDWGTAAKVKEEEEWRFEGDEFKPETCKSCGCSVEAVRAAALELRLSIWRPYLDCGLLWV
jgi:hypothetical protein